MTITIPDVLQNWKSTVSGLLTLLVVGGAYLTTNPPPGLSAREMGWATFVGGLAKIYLALIQKDAK
jgi:hypothetical protein